jgi:hypothetical protein
MTQEEDTRILLHTAAEKYNAGPPPLHKLLRSGKQVKRRRRLFVSASSAVAAAALVMGGVALLPQADSGALPVVDATPTKAPSEFDLDSIKGLTGKDVGDALGLTPWSPRGEEIQECDGTYAEYSDPPGDGNAVGFCLAGITDDPVEELVIAKQVNGFEQTETLKALAAAMVELRNDKQGGAAHSELARKVSELLQQLAAQERVG